MSETVMTTGATRARRRLDTAQRAWIVLLIAFAVFCLTCVVTGYGVNYFLFRSMVPMQASLEVGRGTAAYLERSDLDENVAPVTGHFLVNNERVRLDPQSQATLLFRDTYQNNRLIASVTLKGGTSVYMNSAARPRFNWSSEQYRVTLTNLIGEIDVFVPEGLERGVWIRVENSEGGLVLLAESGNYTINSTGAQLSVTNRRGRAVLVPPDEQNPRLVADNERGVMSLESPDYEIAVSPASLNLLQPGELQNIPAQDVLTTNMLLPDLVWPWQCGDSAATPPGRYEVGMPEGRPAIRFVRADNASTHGETACSQSPGPGQTGRDVSAYSSLILKATFYIESHSLALCGQDGSECPLTIQIDYVFRDELGDENLNQWFHGFYVNPDPSGTYPTRCSSCLVDHEPVYGGTWYTYESPNLFNLIPPAQRPVSLLRVRFYASGHQYDVYVGDMALFAS